MFAKKKAQNKYFEPFFNDSGVVEMENRCHRTLKPMSYAPLDRLKLQGYKSIANCDLHMRNLNVLIGANGAGKSNFISFFKLVRQILESKLQVTVSKSGGPDAMLHFGRKTTPALHAELYFGNNGYKFSLEPTLDNRMMFSKEALFWNMRGDVEYPSGQFETQTSVKIGGQVRDFTVTSMKKWQVYHFHDTSDNAPVKQKRTMIDWEYLRPDAANLAIYLACLRNLFPNDFSNIEKTIQLVAPFFDRFRLEPDPFNPELIELMWFEKGSDIPFKAHQLSDGTLRFICLATLLLAPADTELIIIDEPELGLHPYAIKVLAGLIKSASTHKQIIISTQSVELLSEFTPKDVIVVDRKDNQSILTRLNAEDYKDWLEEYTLGELWTKNILGGRPS
jgi:predicted ATPase